MDPPIDPMMPLGEMTPTPLTWLWAGRLALGKLSIFDGDPGRGKSLVTLDLCARITTGRPMPDGAGAAAPANVVIIQGEDGPADTVLPRLRALGADLSRVYVFKREFLEKDGPFSLPTGTETLRIALGKIQPRFVVIDPIMAFLDRSIMANNDQSIRRALTPLADLIAAHACACILVRHLNKSGRRRALYRGGGSIGFSAACRSAWLFDLDPNDPTRMIMAQTKNNMALSQASLAFRIVSQPEGEPIVEWLGRSTVSADELLTHAGWQKPLLRDRAEDFLPVFLADGPRTTEEIWPAARAHGIQQRTLQNARKALGIMSTNVWNGAKTVTYWNYSGQKLPDSIPPEHRPDDISDLFAEVRKQYPLDPLDDESHYD